MRLQQAKLTQTANSNITHLDALSFALAQPAAFTVNFDSETKYTNRITALAADHISFISSKEYVVKTIAWTVAETVALTLGW